MEYNPKSLKNIKEINIYIYILCDRNEVRYKASTPNVHTFTWTHRKVYICKSVNNLGLLLNGGNSNHGINIEMNVENWIIESLYGIDIISNHIFVYSYTERSDQNCMGICNCYLYAYLICVQSRLYFPSRLIKHFSLGDCLHSGSLVCLDIQLYDGQHLPWYHVNHQHYVIRWEISSFVYVLMSNFYS